MSIFDPTKPYNSLPLLPPKDDYYNLLIYKKVVKATDELSKLNGLLISAWDNVVATMNMLSPFYASEAEASSKVENIITSTEEILLAGIIDESQQSDAQKEGRAYLNALATGAKILDEKDLLTTNIFLEIQSQLSVSAPGIRKTIGTQLKNDRNGKIYYTPPVGEQKIRDLLKNLEIYINTDNEEVDPLIKMALIHYQFEAIHPFYDGNGRTGRIIMPLYLQLTRKTQYPFLFISGYILKNKEQYYQLIQDVHINQNWISWVDFILDGVIETANRMSATLIEIKSLKDIMKEDVSKNIPFKHNEVLQFIFNEPVFNRKLMEQNLNIHSNSAKKYSEQLCELGIVHKRKVHKQWVYVNIELVNILKRYSDWV